MNNKRIWLSLAEMGGEEQRFIQEAFDTNWVVPLGPNVNGFEADLESYLQIEGKRVVALSAGTAALHLGLVMLGVGRGDEVICQSFTFSASANPIVYQGASPIFVDSEPDTWNMDPKALEAAIKDRIAKTGRKPKAIIPVHLYGMPAKMDEIMAIAQKYDIPVLEDAAEAIGSTYKGRRCGSFGAYGALSFNGNKMITTSGGGGVGLPRWRGGQVGDVLCYAGTRRSSALSAQPHRLQLSHEQYMCRHRTRADARSGASYRQEKAESPSLYGATRRRKRHQRPGQSVVGLRLQLLAHLHSGRSRRSRLQQGRGATGTGGGEYRESSAMEAHAPTACLQPVPVLRGRDERSSLQRRALPAERFAPRKRGSGTRVSGDQRIGPLAPCEQRTSLLPITTIPCRRSA